jgi:hypothetical protein
MEIMSMTDAGSSVLATASSFHDKNTVTDRDRFAIASTLTEIMNGTTTNAHSLFRKNGGVSNEVFRSKDEKAREDVVYSTIQLGMKDLAGGDGVLTREEMDKLLSGGGMTDVQRARFRDIVDNEMGLNLDRNPNAKDNMLFEMMGMSYFKGLELQAQAGSSGTQAGQIDVSRYTSEGSLQIVGTGSNQKVDSGFSLG